MDNCKSNTENDFITESEDYFEEEERNIAVPLACNLQDVVQKVQKIVKLFRKSPVKNDDHLQPYILENLGKKMLLLDCKTKWNSFIDKARKILRAKERNQNGYGTT